MINKIFSALLLFASLLAIIPSGAYAGRFPAPKGYVNDFAGVIDPASATELEGFLKDLQARTTAEVAVVTVPDLDGFADIDEYGIALASEWAIGKKGEDNGVLILLSMKEKKVRIDVGYGLEGAITDGATGDIRRNIMAPHFQKGEYGAGLLESAKAIAALIPPGGVKKPGRTKAVRGLIRPIAIAVFIIIAIIIQLLPGGRFRGGRGGRFYGGGPFIGGFGGGFGGGGLGGGGGFGGGFGGFGGGGFGGGGSSGGW